MLDTRTQSERATRIADNETQKETVGVIGMGKIEKITGNFHDDYISAMESIRRQKLEKWIILHGFEMPRELMKLMHEYLKEPSEPNLEKAFMWMTENGYSFEFQSPQDNGIKIEGMEMSFSLDPDDFKLVIKKVMWEI